MEWGMCGITSAQRLGGLATGRVGLGVGSIRNCPSRRRRWRACARHEPTTSPRRPFSRGTSGGNGPEETRHGWPWMTGRFGRLQPPRDAALRGRGSVRSVAGWPRRSPEPTPRPSDFGVLSATSNPLGKEECRGAKSPIPKGKLPTNSKYENARLRGRRGSDLPQCTSDSRLVLSGLR